MKAYERLIKYASFPTGSFEENPDCPSNPDEFILARHLENELRELGCVNTQVDGHGYVYGFLPANDGGARKKKIGFIAHMDTVSEVEFRNCRPRVEKDYAGGDIVLNAEKGIVMKRSEFPVLEKYIGQDLVVTDGTTVLGADDKAGVAEIVTMLERFKNDPTLPHGDIAVGFTPDEEIGRGADLFNVPLFACDGAYTVDGGSFGQIEYENFNAVNATVYFYGKAVHPGDAKAGGMINASRLALEFDSLLPENERCEYTSGYEGFYHLIGIKGTTEEAESKYILRDHDAGKIEIKKQTLCRAADYLNARYGEGRVKVDAKDVYRNMAEYVKKAFWLVENAKAAIEAAGGTPDVSPIRGGTDGARLSYEGLPCPNLGTGSQNHHGRFEFAGVQDMEKCVDTLINICRLTD